MLQSFQFLIRYDIEFLRHHAKVSRKLRKAAAKVHFSFEFLEDVSVVEEGVREEAVESPHD